MEFVVVVADLVDVSEKKIKNLQKLLYQINHRRILFSNVIIPTILFKTETRLL